jgi:hypothetical protein
MLTSLARKRLSIINVKSGTGDIPGMRHGKQDEATETRSDERIRLTLSRRHGTREAATAGLIPSCP